MAKKGVCVCFDYDNDKKYKYLLGAWGANPQFEFVFNDLTPSEINSDSIDRIKAGLTQKINSASYLMVIVGKYANKVDKNTRNIGDINWINWEINRAKDLKKKLVAVKNR